MAAEPTNKASPGDPEAIPPGGGRWSWRRWVRGRNLGLLVGGTAFSQALTVLALPVLTRLYTPSDFGVMAVFISLVVPLNAIAALRYDMAIPLPESEREANTLLWLSALLMGLFAVALAAVLLPLAPMVTRLTNTPALGPFLWLAPIAFLGGGMYNALSYLAIRRKAFPILAATRVSQGIGQVIAQIGIGLISSGPLGLLVGVTVRFGSGTLTLLRAFRGQLRTMIPVPDYRELVATLGRYRRFPLLTGNATFLNLLGQHLPALLLAVIYGAGVAGLFSLALRIMEAPVRLISKATSQVFFSEGSEAQRGGSVPLANLYLRTLRQQGLLALPILLLVMLPAPWIFPWVFGPEWREAGLYLQLLAVMFFLQYLAKSIGPETLTLVGRQDLHLILEAIKTILLLALFAAAAFFELPALVTVGIYGAVVSLIHLATLTSGWLLVRRLPT